MEDIEDMDRVFDTDTAGDVVVADGVVLDFDLPDEMVGMEDIGDLDGAKDTVEGDDDDNMQSSSEVSDVIVAKGVN